MNEEYVKGFISALNPSRSKDAIEGHHPSLDLWKSWYKGDTKFHNINVIENGVYTTRKIKSGMMAKEVAGDLANTFMNERIEIVLPSDDETKLMNQILEKNGFKGKIKRFTEKYMALSEGAIVVTPSRLDFDSDTGYVIDGDGIDVKIRLLDVDRIIPITVDDDELIELGVIRFTTNKCYLQLHLKNEYGYYDISECEGVKDNGKFNFDYENCKTWHTKTKEPLFSDWYPQKADNVYLNNNRGISVFADCIEDLETYDMIYDKFYIEFKNGGKKRFISSDLRYTGADGEVKQVTLGEEDVYLPSGRDGNAMVTENNPALRVDAFIRALSFQANVIAKKVGLGDSQYQFDGVSGKPKQTATAEVLDKQDALEFIRSNEHFAIAQLKKMAMAIKYVYNNFVKESFTFNVEDIQISFDDNIIEDTTSKKEHELTEVNAGVMTLAEFRSHWYDEDYETALEFVQENGLLIDKYLSALTSGVISPAMYVQLVFGDTVDGKEELIAYITEKMSAPIETPINMDDTDEVEDEETSIQEEEQPTN